MRMELARQIALIILACFCLRSETKSQVGDTILVDTLQGRLGHLLGIELTISGMRIEKGKGVYQVLLVDTVNGQKLWNPVGIWIDNVKQGLPKGQRCILTGRERGEWIGGESDQQAIRQFYRYFVVDSVKQPSSLMIIK